VALLSATLPSQQSQQSQRPDLVFPGLLAKEQREAGNPLATYAAMLELDAAYRAHPVFAKIYPEVRCNFEQFLGDADAGPRAMRLLARPGGTAGADAALPARHVPRAAVEVIARAAARTRVVVFGEEHHLPQTRSLFEPLLHELHRLGYRYLAAETFTAAVMAPGATPPDHRSGYYTMDPVFANAVRTARKLGWTLIAYDTSERGPDGDGSFRDRTQAQNLQRLVLDADPKAKLLVLAGRAHAAETVAADGWTPMASVLKRSTGIDPFTVYAPTMSARLTRDEEDPRYRAATRAGLVTEPVIFLADGGDGAPLGSDSFDAYVFWPRPVVVDGRPDWLATTLGRRRTPVPQALRAGDGLAAVQAFAAGEPASAVPVDQVLLRPGEAPPVLMLPAGSFWLRRIDPHGATVGPVELDVK
jgi:hypothetical protein